MPEHDAWPALPYEEWAPTKKTLHMAAQMLGKTRLALAPPQPEWLHACLYLDARGFATGPMPMGTRVVTAGIDVFHATLWIHASDGDEAIVPLAHDRCVADIWTDYQAALATLGIQAELTDDPQEVPDAVPFSQNREGCAFVPEHAQRFHRVLTSIDGVYERFRSDFFGRSGIQFWWGAFDFAVLLFTGRHESAPERLGYIMRYDLDAEHLNAGFWVGNDSAPSASFYSYLVPRPDGCDSAPIRPECAGWVEAMSEWIMPYDAMNTLDDPAEALMQFLTSTYEIALEKGGWDAVQLSYSKPPARG